MSKVRGDAIIAAQEAGFDSLCGMAAIDELFLALTCRFALDIFTIIQQDYPVALEEDTPFDLELEDLG